ncbi:MAG: hypothetical protein QM289_01810, partial [Bacillota bacterium]|nr:hypothetical protein [Bacillota bacterium]
ENFILIFSYYGVCYEKDIQKQAILTMAPTRSVTGAGLIPLVMEVGLIPLGTEAEPVRQMIQAALDRQMAGAKQGRRMKVGPTLQGTETTLIQ